MAALAIEDPELFDLIRSEEIRQRECIELIASENFTSAAVRDCLGSCLTNKYSEGYPGARYYGGNEYIDQIESLCQQRALKAFGLSAEEWHVNVQPYSGSPANMAVYTALLKPHDRIMGLDLPDGGHLTHGFSVLAKDNEGRAYRKPVSASSIFFESMPYHIDAATGFLDYDKIEEQVKAYKPALLIAGASAYPRDWNYKRMRLIADSVGAFLLVDMAHIAGLVAAGEAESPFKWADVVTTTTHKTLRGPRSGLIFCRKDYRKMDKKIDAAVFPALQGGPHQHQIAGVATQLREVATPEFKNYIIAVKDNCHVLAEYLKEKGMKLATDGTDNHLLLWDLKPFALTGAKMQAVCDAVNITLNKNSMKGDTTVPTGVRIGTAAMTTRGLKAADFEAVGSFLIEAVDLAVKINSGLPQNSKLADFQEAVNSNEKYKSQLQDLKEAVTKFAKSFY
jgi:glycine hydroxymethyltransferase